MGEIRESSEYTSVGKFRAAPVAPAADAGSRPPGPIKILRTQSQRTPTPSYIVTFADVARSPTKLGGLRKAK